MKFNFGDVVHWTSQSGGYTKTKCGVISCAIAAGARPGAPEGVKKPGSSRKALSYVVRVGEKYYWPKVEYLKPGKPQPEDKRTVATRIRDDLYEGGFSIVLKDSYLMPHAGYDEEIDKIIESAIERSQQNDTKRSR